MMRATHIAGLLMGVSLLLAAGHAEAQSDLPPAKILRSLQFVQDSVVMGDHSARDMQKFLLSAFDTTLRTSDMSVFSDTKNADAALIYIMSGGNPATLNYLVAKDVQGYFDSRVVNVLQKYLSGRGGLVDKVVSDLIPEYRNNRLGPYLMLIAGNIAYTKDPAAALPFFDDARLSAPGTIIEEAALRRSIMATMQLKQPEKGMVYARKYAVRFLHSPYASQFADLFVSLAIDSFGPVTTKDIGEIAELMDAERAQEIYLRIARQASLQGKMELAQFAADKANGIAEDTGDTTREPLSKLYSGLSDISGQDVLAAQEKLASIPESELSPRDLALRDAAKTIAEQIMQPPSLAAATTVSSSSGPATEGSRAPVPAGKTEEAASQAADAAPLKTFFDKNRARLNEIDSMLKQEGG
ncbi:chemotaxis protein [Agrobacterium tumefaciens]|uniref:Chemotaxis protein n=2 Tax=Rhizobium rhizogenes TaxID=359 RepID=A0AA92H970_RHIRH|nr:chemotaxis protein [Rhizobium rhizogenes]PVE66598.1 chemotaxis protein [Agrobacterium tumefaciens]PVE76586.1 chemotaxis protein [Sphingomonas sp. TPD3009]